ncbi:MULTISPECIES: transcriptional regulator [Proteiniphilum]|jgi:predicted transcriptional regulator|uniref:transcriptional regulator n=1 Tax=Proteiniphilum TaxID=294702 RepID=UPI001EEA0AB1|nr:MULTISPECIES: transcriptional regulator [Proteiniphilum]MDD2245979.1 transcriptional regulator [Proteiniphilum sp.]MDD3910140.1 transcriptional regulator [Proteiniphilum sp.]MDD4415859.1 transcriptional regulator [Proteiniphilum sp.]ULB34868.1 transcriptional regulator [Proteiniphilum propionicum]
MNLQRVNEIIDGTIQLDCNTLHNYTNAFASDLMSDVLRFQMENTILITGLCTVQAIRTAEIINISCIIFGRGKQVTDEMLALAKEHNISIVATDSTVFEISGKLYQNGLKPVSL